MFNVLKARIKPLKNKLLLAAAISGICISSVTAQTVQPFGDGITAKSFYSSTIDENNTVWFLTESGIISFDGTNWSLHNKNSKIATSGLKNVVYERTPSGPELWIATSQGAIVAIPPVNAGSVATTYLPENSSNVLAIALGSKELRWVGTDKGVSAIKDKKWLTNSYNRTYPEGLFEDTPITSMATSLNGDSLYIGTLGGGVLRVYRNDVDAVSGASEFAAWGPILMPSDTVYSVHIAANGTQWIGTSMGVAKHEGYRTLEGWTVYTTAEGLAHDKVQAISSDSKGNIYFGTKNGLSVYNGKNWITYKTENGLVSNNILSISVDKKDGIWIGTDNGVTILSAGKFTSYR